MPLRSCWSTGSLPGQVRSGGSRIGRPFTGTGTERLSPTSPACWMSPTGKPPSFGPGRARRGSPGASPPQRWGSGNIFPGATASPVPATAKSSGWRTGSSPCPGRSSSPGPFHRRKTMGPKRPGNASFQGRTPSSTWSAGRPCLTALPDGWSSRGSPSGTGKGACSG